MTRSCNVTFDNVIYWDGALEATDVEISNCTVPSMSGTFTHQIIL